MKSPSSLRSTPAHRQDRIAMTPMIDIVFLLIIFFLVSSHLSRQENRYPVTLSQATTGTLGHPTDSSLTITIDSELRIHFASTIITIDRLHDRLTAWLASLPRGQDRADVSVRLRIDQSVPYGDVEPVLKELAVLSIGDLSILVNPSEGSASTGAEF